jgi:tRNA A37 threonylcarbamoyladenosine biosynthesis protein TsaE
VYEAPSGCRLAHYDFYRLVDAGIMSSELAESLSDRQTITILEWAELVAGVLPSDVLRITIISLTEDSRLLKLAAGGESSRVLLGALA